MKSASSDRAWQSRFVVRMFTALTGVLLIWSIHDELRSVAARHWTVVSASVVDQQTVKDCDKGLGFHVVLSYSFRAKDGSARSGDTALPYNDCVDAAGAAALADAHPVGSAIAVRVDPGNAAHHRADAEVSSDHSAGFVLMFGLMFGALVLGQMASVRRFFLMDR